VRRADVLIENFSPGTLDRLGVGYEHLRSVNPTLIYASISGFGADQTGAKAMDTIVQALSGLMMTSGLPGDPPVRVGLPVADLVAPLFSVIGILSALHQRSRTGKGQHVDVSMLGALTSMIAAEPFEQLEQCGVPMRTGRMMPRLPPFGVYQTADGYIAICAPTDTQARGVFEAIGARELASDSRFRTRDDRVMNVDALNGIIETYTRSCPTASLMARFAECGVPAAEVRSPAAAVRDPRVLARRETEPLLHPRGTGDPEIIGMGLPIAFSESSVGPQSTAPAVGQDNERVYRDWLGYSSERLASLVRDAVI
jgi:crotonobetainyl-CoA:carnitine CoA-transferase CaiB-like acyl-CoA transferase